MTKPPAHRLRRATYPWTFDVLPRFGDMDTLRHLNNVALARIYEDARFRFQHGIDTHGTLPPGHGFLVAEVAIRYLAEGRYPDPLVAACGIGAVGRSSFVIAQALFQHDRCIGTADVTLVHVERAAARPATLPEATAALFAAHSLTGAGASDISEKEPAHA